MKSPTSSERTPRVPLHRKISEEIRTGALDGALVDDAGRLMTEAELGRHFGVSRITIRDAIRPLVEAGMFARERGRGTFLRANPAENWMGRLIGLSESIREAGFEPGARVLRQGMAKAPDDGVGAGLGERAVFELRRLRLADDQPIAIEHAFYPPDIGLELERRDLTSIVMYRVFETELGLDIGEARQTVSARLAEEEEAALLGTEPGNPLITMERLTSAKDGRPLELLRSVYRPEFYRFTITLTRRGT